MSSSVHFKFKSQKEPSRVTFDGTGISVFELKREIININRLGDGTDFELSIYNEDNNEEYEDDTTIIPRSTSVIARRLPAARPGRGGAARYVSGKAPVNARNASRLEAPLKGGRAGGDGAPGRLLDLSEAQSEEDRIKAVLNLESSQWSQQQQEMANATPVQFGRGRPKQMVPTGPERPLPPGYLCYRCREKGHWIHNCPTNNDPSFDGRVRVKRTTGIPRSQLKTVEKPELLAALDGAGGDGQTTGIMVNAEGDFVIAQPDKATWEIYSEKLKEISAAEKRAEASGSQELQSRGLQCPIDKRMFVDPMKTPCCGKTYCNDCITNALIDSDFVCPNCSTAGVLIDDLTADEEIVERLKSYEAEKVNKKKEKEREKDDQSATETTPQSDPKDTDKRLETNEGNTANKVESSANKRGAASPTLAAAGETLTDSPPAKKVKPNEALDKDEASKTQTPPATSSSSNPTQANLPFNPAMPFAQFPPMGPQGMLPMGFPGGIMGMPMNPLMMQQQAAFMNMNGGWNQMPGMDFSNMYGSGGFPNGMMQNPMFPHMSNMPMNFNNHGSNQSRPMQQNLNGGGQAFGNQTTNLNGQGDNAYMRAPVNPHRHQGRQKRVRPHDYREL